MKETDVSETREYSTCEISEQKESMKERYERMTLNMSPEALAQFHRDISLEKYNEWHKSNKGTRDDFRKDVMDRYEKIEKEQPSEALNIREGEQIKIQSPNIRMTNQELSKGSKLEYETAEIPKDFRLNLPENSIVYVKEFKDTRQKIWDNIQEHPDKNGFQDNEMYKAVTTQELTLYRTYGKSSHADGCFVTTERDMDPIDAKTYNAIPYEWNNHKYTEKVTIPAGTEIYVGKVGEQPTYLSGERINGEGKKETYPASTETFGGGNDQIVLPKNYTAFCNVSGTPVLSDKKELVRNRD